MSELGEAKKKCDIGPVPTTRSMLWCNELSLGLHNKAERGGCIHIDVEAVTTHAGLMSLASSI